MALVAGACGDDTGSAQPDDSSSSSSVSDPDSSSSDDASSSGAGSSSSSSGSSSSTSDGSSSDEASSSGESSSGTTGTEPSGGAVDVLFVIDNSATMGLEQAKLAEAIGGFVETLDAAAIDWRIGVTTTDNGNPWCNGSSPEGGHLQATSCRARLGEFVWNGAVPIDATDEACLDVCAHDELSIQPTSTDLDPTPLPRPWIETIGGVGNVGDGLSPAEAVACMLPQGIVGCGFEQPLESMNKALLRATTSEESQYGFLRAGVLTTIVVVTDEADCSYQSDFESIFLPEDLGGNEVFWSDPDLPAPTSAVCWNAGTVCTGGPGTYDECHAADLGLDGSEVAQQDEAVLRPISYYAGELASYGTVYLAAIDGVPIGYEDGAVDVPFADDPDPQAQIDWGIGPACEADGESALPSVRIRELVEDVDAGERNDFSSCEDSYDGALQTIAERIIARQE